MTDPAGAAGRVVDAWANIFPPELAAQWVGQEANRSVGEAFGGSTADGATEDALIARMDDVGVDAAIVTAGLRLRPDRANGFPTVESLLEAADRHPGRLYVSATVDRAARPTRNVARIRELAAHDRFRLVRITPLVEQHDLNAALYYPVYAACEELGLPVSINVGIPMPRVRSACQHPQLLEDVLIDFPDLTVVGAHMGHPYESLLIQYMLKWPNLYLMTSAYLATYMDPAVVRFMGSSRGRGRVLFASDHPVIDVGRALKAARELDLDEASMSAFLSGAADEVLLRP